MPSSNQKTIGNNIRLWRVIKGLKQIELANTIGVSKTTLSKIENDKQNVSLERLQQIASCLRIKTTLLFNDPSDLLIPPKDNF